MYGGSFGSAGVDFDDDPPLPARDRVGLLVKGNNGGGPGGVPRPAFWPSPFDSQSLENSLLGLRDVKFKLATLFATYWGMLEKKFDISFLWLQGVPLEETRLAGEGGCLISFDYQRYPFQRKLPSPI